MWFAARTGSQCEFKLQRQLDFYGVKNFLPLYTDERKWTDRIKRVKTPLISGYVFTEMVQNSEAMAMMWCAGFRGWVSFHGKPAMIPDSEIELLHTMVSMSPCPSPFHSGDTIRVTRGPLLGVTGTVDRSKGTRLIFKPVSYIASALSIEVSEDQVEKV